MGFVDELRTWIKKRVGVQSQGDLKDVKSNEEQEADNRTPAKADIAGSQPHLLLLKRFLFGAEIRESNDQRWAAVLGENEVAAVAGLLGRGLLLDAPLEAAIQSAFQVKELKAFARERGLKVSGTKLELAQRLVAADGAGSRQLLGARRFLVCSDQGRQLVDAYVEEQNAARAEAEQLTLELLKQRRLRDAARTVAYFEAKQVFARGVGINWGASEDPLGIVGELESIFSATELAPISWTPSM